MEEEYEFVYDEKKQVAPFLAAGMIAGVSAILTSHPFDTIKTKVQLSENPVSCYEVCCKIYRSSGLKAFFSGASSPLLGRAPLTAAFFTAHEHIRPVIESFNLESRNTRNFLGGSMASACLMPILIPVELFKCQAQGWTKQTRFSLKQAVRQQYRA